MSRQDLLVSEERAVEAFRAYVAAHPERLP